MESEGSRIGEWRLLGLVGVGDVMIVVSQGSCKQGESTYTYSFQTRGFLENSMRPVPGLVMSVNISKARIGGCGFQDHQQTRGMEVIDDGLIHQSRETD